MTGLPPLPQSTQDDAMPRPAARRVIWQHGMDLSLTLRACLFAIALESVAILVMGAVLFAVFSRPPVVLDQNDGYLMWRTTEAFRLSPDMLGSYCRMVLRTLYTVTPGHYDLAELTGKVDGRVLEEFSKRTSGDIVVAANQRRVYDLLEVRRYADPNFPQYVTVAVRGERALYEYNPAAAQPFKMQSGNQVNVLYLSRRPPTPDNPWGLVVVGLVSVDPAEADALWARAAPLVEEPRRDNEAPGPPQGSRLFRRNNR